jgi:hypothetical protein
VIGRNTPVPIEQTRSFTTARDGQESVTIRVYQGESREAAENELLGQFEFSNFQRGARGEVEIDVTFEINTDGIVNVTASDKRTGQQASTRITLSSGLSEREIQNIIERGVASRVQTTALPAAPSVAKPTAPKPDAPRPPAPRAAAPAPAPVRAPAPAPAPVLDDDDALIPIPEEDLLADGDDLGDDELLDGEPDAITQPDRPPVATTPPPPAPAPPAPARVAAPEIARPGDEIELSEADLAALDTSDLEPLAEGESLFDTSGVDLSEGRDPEPRD